MQAGHTQCAVVLCVVLRKKCEFEAMPGMGSVKIIIIIL